MPHVNLFVVVCISKPFQFLRLHLGQTHTGQEKNKGCELRNKKIGGDWRLGRFLLPLICLSLPFDICFPSAPFAALGQGSRQRRGMCGILCVCRCVVVSIVIVVVG